MTETIHEKAQRFIAEGRITIRHEGETLVDADVEGDHDRYAVVVEIGDDVRCTCPATGDCSHMLAVLALSLARRTGLPTAVALG